MSHLWSLNLDTWVTWSKSRIWFPENMQNYMYTFKALQVTSDSSALLKCKHHAVTRKLMACVAFINIRFSLRRRNKHSLMCGLFNIIEHYRVFVRYTGIYERQHGVFRCFRKRKMAFWPGFSASSVVYGLD